MITEHLDDKDGLIYLGDLTLEYFARQQQKFKFSKFLL